jgi:hypothetical protein
LQFGFVIFWQKNIDAEAVHKLLMKLTTEVYFANILLAAYIFSPKNYKAHL